ncbi:MAG: hypothetical protein QOJ29_117, partial [Thermoleophilaceae bacterium]|nr:hypothetical protein [Thermoleophilaceae bacterium]
MTASGRTRYDKLAGTAGIAAMLLLLVGFLAPGAPPKANDSAKQVTAFLVDNRGALLAGSFLIGLGSAVFLLWVSGVRRRLLDAGAERVLADAAFAAGAVAAALNLTGSAITAGTAFEAAGLGDATLNRALFDTATDVFTIAGFAIAVLFVTVAASAASGAAFPRWVSTAGYVAAGLQVVSCVALFAKSGFFAAGGAFTLLAFATAVLWGIGVSAAMVRT